MFLYLFVYLQILIKVVQAISDNVIIEMPSFVSEGGDARLSCYFEHVLDGKPLYQLQWQFNGKEFYRFNGKYTSQKLQEFSIPGLFQVDVSTFDILGILRSPSRSFNKVTFHLLLKLSCHEPLSLSSCSHGWHIPLRVKFVMSQRQRPVFPSSLLFSVFRVCFHFK